MRASPIVVLPLSRRALSGLFPSTRNGGYTAPTLMGAMGRVFPAIRMRRFLLKNRILRKAPAGALLRGL